MVPPIYKPYFVHDLDLKDIDISSGDFPTTKLASAIVKSSMIEYSVHIYMKERENVKPKPISAWFCPDVSVAEVTLENIEKMGISCAIVTAQTPLTERMNVLGEHVQQRGALVDDEKIRFFIPSLPCINNTLIRENRLELYESCIYFLKTRIKLDQSGFTEDIFQH